MKRGWIGLGLLTALLAAGLWTSWRMDTTHREIAQELELAARQATAGQWEEAEDNAEDAWETWQERWHFSAAFADHAPMEEIDARFAQLDAYRAARDSVRFAALCRDLARQVEAMGDAHSLTWWNFL